MSGPKGASRSHLTKLGGFPGKFHRDVRPGHLGEGERGVRAFPAKIDGMEVTENKM